MDGDPQLFGSLPGGPASCVVNITNPEAKALGRVRLEVFCTGRRDPMRITIDDLPTERMATAIGYIIPLMTKCHYVNTSQLRRHFWAVWRQLSIAGWDIGIAGCGKEK